MVSNSPDLVDVEFALYKKYQVTHHGDKPGEVTPGQFRRFLIDTPLPHVPAHSAPPGAAPPCGLGSFHQQYWLDGVLIAVGVLDVLPRCLSSKYFFWDPDLRGLSLGKLAALKEIEWVREASQYCPGLRYYYMGYYIHSCPKMRYKAEYVPSDLLCHRRMCWVPHARIQHALRDKEAVVISQVPGALASLDPARYRTEHTQPLPEPNQVSLEALLSTQLWLDGVRGADGKRRQAVVPLRVLLPSLLNANKQWAVALQQQLARWHAVVGPVAQLLLYIMPSSKSDGPFQRGAAEDEEPDSEEDEEEEGGGAAQQEQASEQLQPRPQAPADRHNKSQQGAGSRGGAEASGGGSDISVEGGDVSGGGDDVSDMSVEPAGAGMSHGQQQQQDREGDAKSDAPGDCEHSGQSKAMAVDSAHAAAAAAGAVGAAVGSRCDAAAGTGASLKRCRSPPQQR